MLEWTALYCGEEHLKGLPDGYQITIENGNEVYLVNKRGPHPFTAIKTFYGTPEQVRRVGAEWGIQIIDEFEGKE